MRDADTSYVRRACIRLGHAYTHKYAILSRFYPIVRAFARSCAIGIHYTSRRIRYVLSRVHTRAYILYPEDADQRGDASSSIGRGRAIAHRTAGPL